MSWLSRSGSRLSQAPHTQHPGAGGGPRRLPSPTRAPSLFVVRSSDGAEFGLTKDDFRNISTLDELRFNLLSPLLSIRPDCLILMNEEGSPLNRDEAVQHLALLASTPASSVVLPGREKEREVGTEKRIYVFDREHLDAEPEEVARALAITEEMVMTEPPLNPEDPLHSHLSLSEHNLTTLRALITSIQLQHSSLHLALSNLHRVNTGTSSSFSLFLDQANPTMERYERLLSGWEGAMDAVGKVAVVAGLLGRGGGGGSGHGREGSTVSVSGGGGGTLQMEGGKAEKQRFLGDYVSREKMLAVRDGCAKVLAELRLRTEGVQATLNDVIASAEAVQADLEMTSHDLQDLEACEQDAEHGHLRIEELVQAGEEMTHPDLQAQCFEELSVCDAEHRDRIRFLVERKNAMTRYLLQEMQKISTLQSDIASMPPELSALDHDLATRTDNFKHLARLEGLIPAYVATVAEVVRRREYYRLLQTQSTALSSSFAPLTTLERTRRTTYRSTFSGKLPWEVRGLHVSTDEQIPEMSLAVEQGGQEALPELGRETLKELGRAFEQLEGELGEGVGEENPIRVAKWLLEKLREHVKELEREFEQVSLNPPPPRPPSIDPSRLADLEAQLRQLEESNDALTRELQTERSSREEEVAQLESRYSATEGASHLLRTRIDQLEADKVELEKQRREAVSRANGKERDLLLEQEKREAVERELSSARGAEEEVQRQWEEINHSYARLQEEYGAKVGEVEELRKEMEEGEGVLEKVKEGARELRHRLSAVEEEKRVREEKGQVEKKAAEKEKEELRKTFEAREGEVELQQQRIRTLEEVHDGLREQIARWEAVAQEKEEEVGGAKKEVENARREKEKGIVEVQKELVRMEKLAREAVRLAGRMRDENNNITDILNAPPPPSSSSKGGESSTLDLDKVASPSLPTSFDPSSISLSAAASSPSVPPLDYTAGDLDNLLAELSKYSHDALTDAVKHKVDSLTNVTKKWVKEAKAYRERAHRAASATNDKIAFRNFAKGDLALFLPTRNSAVPVWAAFNVSFPHHFLSATGVIAEQMKTREWIVARITSLSEKVVDPKDPSTNPYLLAAGTKFFTLEVEPWSSKESSRSRRHSTADKGKSSEKKSSKEARASRISESAITTRSAATADSAILVDRPSTVSASTPNIRRTVSEGGPFPPNATALARSEYAIVEADEEQQEADSRTPSPPALPQQIPRPEDRYESPISIPSALSRALARSTSTSPTTERRSDPFTPSSFSNPFATSSSPVPDSPLRHVPSPPTTDYDPSHSTAGAAPAFLPSSGKKSHPTGSSSARGHSHSPRYVRSAARPITSSSRTPHAASKPSPNLLSASPASTSASSINVVSHPRSGSSGSSILSSSIQQYRRSSAATLGKSGISLPVPSGGKAPSTQEAQMSGSRWNLLQEDLAPPPTTSTTTSSSSTGSRRSPPAASSTPASGSMTLGRKTTKGWPGGSGPSSSASPSSSSPGKGSIFDVFTGRRASTTAGGAGGGGKKDSAAATGSGAEGEIRKLLGQPQF
ncbi:hypothetical protein JCM8547_009283 [Rhodosporidiobolus lusitaniae]